MSKYFYRDPIAAAFMATHHGIKLNYTINNILAHVIGDTEDFKPPYFIQPESVSLLGPMTGDMLWRGIGSYIVDPVNLNAKVPQRLLSEGWKIIQRKGVPFMTPECEE